MPDHARRRVEPGGQLGRTSHVGSVEVGDRAAVGTPVRVCPHPGPRKRPQRRLEPEGQELQRHRCPERGDLLLGRHDHHEPCRSRGHDLLARVRPATAFDQPPVGRDLIGPVHGDVELVQAVEGLDVQPGREGRSLRRR